MNTIAAAQDPIPKCVSSKELAHGKPFDPYTVCWRPPIQEKILFHPTMKPTTRNLLLGLMHLMKGNNQLEIPVPELARRFHMGEQTVRRSLITLVKDGFVLPYCRPGKVTALQLGYHPLFDPPPLRRPRPNWQGYPYQNGRTPLPKWQGSSLLIKDVKSTLVPSANGKLLALEGSPAPEPTLADPSGNRPPRRLPRFTTDHRTYGLHPVAAQAWLDLLPAEQDKHERTAKELAKALKPAIEKWNNPDPTIAETGEREINELHDKLGAVGFEPKTPITKKPLP